MLPPFFPRTANNGLPSDINRLVLKELNVNELTNLRLTSTEMMSDDELKKLQELDVQRAQALRSTFRIPNSRIPEVILELKTFLGKLLEVFSESNLGNIQVYANSYAIELENERNNLKLNQHEEFIYLNSIQDDRVRSNSGSGLDFRSLIIINEIKSSMVEQENILAEFNQFPVSNLSSSTLNHAHEQKVIGNFTNYPQFASLYFLDLKHCVNQIEYFRSAHEQEDAIALFASHPPKMQSYLVERHKNDYLLQYNWLRSRIIGTKHEKRDLALLDKKFAPDGVVKHRFLPQLIRSTLKLKI
jgi:hypothetical protein